MQAAQGAEDRGHVAVRAGADDIEGLRKRGADGSGALQDRAEGVELSGGPMGEVGKRAVADLAAETKTPWIAAVSVGTLWAVWHLPLFFLKGWTSSSPTAYLLIVIGLSLVMAYGFNAAGRSVLVAILMHSAFNSSPRFIGPFLDGTSTRNY